MDPQKTKWFVLNNFIQQSEHKEEVLISDFKRDCSTSIKSFIYNKKDKKEIITKIKNSFKKGENGFRIFGTSKEIYNMFLLEYPWSTLCETDINNECFIEELGDIRHFETTLEYKTEEPYKGNVSFLIPHPSFIKEFNLTASKDKTYTWKHDLDKLILKNTLIEDGVNNVLLVHKNNLHEILNSSGLSIMFISSTEKRLFPKNDSNFKNNTLPWRYYLSLYSLDSEGDLKEELFDQIIDEIN